MRVLIVGGGGREHALALAIARSPRLTRLFAAPGNPGIAEVAECVDIAADDVPALVGFARENAIDLTVVGPEAPLVAGLVDALAAAGLRAFGPGKAAARLEASKAFAKDMCRRNRIPTADGRVFDDAAAALAHLEGVSYPVVVKADGLAAGKGVVVAKDRAEAERAVHGMMKERAFGAAGARVVIEDFLAGTEASVLAICDGRTLAILEPARDHKAAYDFDRGPNTGGMGAICPTAAVTRALLRKVESEVLIPVLHAMERAGSPFKGFLYAGLMLTPSGPKVLEFNVRMGDPEAQAILPRLRTDLLELLDLAAQEKLADAPELSWDPRASCCVVLASEGYPGPIKTGVPIHGLDGSKDAARDDVFVFHAGTARRGGSIVTSGGRVLGVTALGDGVKDACEKAYAAVERIQFQGAFFRSDIGRAEIERVRR
jgi:phosphoribosylamine--glycine ligase